ncbi:MAG: O-antigen ligase family protein [Bacteroidales bacterium]
MSRTNRSIFNHYFYLFALSALVAAIPTSNYVMSVSQILLGVAWLLEGRYKARLSALLRNPFFWALVSIYLMHLAGLLFTTHFDYAWKDLRTKLPLFVIPFVLFSMPTPSTRESRVLIWVHATTLAVAAIIGILLAQKDGIVNYRYFSPGISHIRFSLNISLSIVLLFYEFMIESSWQKRLSTLSFILFFYIYLTFFGATTGFVISALLLFTFVMFVMFKKLPAWMPSLVILFSVVGMAIGLYSVSEEMHKIKNYRPLHDLSHLPLATPRGNPYLHDTLYFGKENGNWVGLYFCEKELAEGWSKRSKLDFYGNDLCGQPLMATLVRYLNSKGLTKDADGLAQLSDEEIRLIEKGVANVHYLKQNALSRALADFYFGYEKYLDGYGTQGNSIMQRFELLKASWAIIKKSPLAGAGTGDIPQVFRQQLKDMNSDLQGTNLRSHNQFLSIAIGFGLPGLIGFLVAMFYPAVKTHFDFRVTAFTLIVFLSMMNEDTIETQAGVTFFAFFMTFLTLMAKETRGAQIT